MTARQPNRLRRTVLGVLLAGVLVELVAFLLLIPLRGGLPTWEALSADRARAAAGGDPRARAADADPTAEVLLRLKDQVIHPYVGYVHDPGANDEEVFEYLGGRRIDAHGFVGEAVTGADPGRVVVGVTGGSVALFFTVFGTEAFVRALKQDPALADKEIVLVTLAQLGYKQPQQLFSLAYFLVRGCHFDWVVNLDGFNEVALPPIENVPKGVTPMFPRSWYWRVEDLPDTELRRLVGQVAWLEGRRAELAGRFERFPLSCSFTGGLVWTLRDRGLARERSAAEARILDHGGDAAGFVATGAFEEPADDAALYRELARIWRESSEQMRGLCAANGIRYYHFLQPNQYVPESKPMEPGERARAWSERSRFREPVERGYPELAAAGAELAASGVAFHDLSRLFADVREPLYADNCCHYNEAGNELLAAAIAARILADPQR